MTERVVITGLGVVSCLGNTTMPVCTEPSGRAARPRALGSGVP